MIEPGSGKLHGERMGADAVPLGERGKPKRNLRPLDRVISQRYSWIFKMVTKGKPPWKYKHMPDIYATPELMRNC